MAKNKIYRFFGAIAAGAVLTAVPACTDTWDDHYDGAADMEGLPKETLWDLINSNPKLSNFASIAQHAKYWKDEKHEVKSYTYADVLKSGQINTVWAPTNDKLTDADRDKWLEECETDGYNVQEQLLTNHISMFRHLSLDNKLDTIRMINGKNMVFDKGEGTFQGQKLIEKNIAAANGTLHIIDGVAPFHYNFYENLKFGDTFNKMKEYVLSRDTTYFARSASIEGLPDENGNPTYVDSVYYTSNLMFNYSYLPATSAEADTWDIVQSGVNMNLTREDSSLVMVIPSDAAWDAAVEMLKPYYKYPSKYVDKDKQNNNVTYNRTIADPDSLAMMSLVQDMIAPSLFNVNIQPKIGGIGGEKWKIEKFIELKGDSAEYVLNTRGDTLRSTELWDKTELFNGNTVKMSNGYAFKLDKWAFPVDFYKPDVEVNVNGGNFFCTSENKYYKAGNASKNVGFNNNIYSDIAEKYGKVYNNDFYFIQSYNGGNPLVEVRLRGNCPHAYVPSAHVMSGKYDVQLVLVPEWYKTIADAGTVDSVYLDQNYVDSVSALCKTKMKVKIRYNKSGTGDATSSDVKISWDTPNKVDTITVIKDFEFPYSYKNMRYSYPTLIIQGDNSSTNAKKGYSWNLCIDKIILKSKVDGSQVEVDPENN